VERGAGEPAVVGHLEIASHCHWGCKESIAWETRRKKKNWKIILKKALVEL
jgi:hypothetical protein